MNDDELAVAREAVAATRAWRDQMRADWGYHREPEEVLDEAVGELLAEQDRLRAQKDRFRDACAGVDAALTEPDDRLSDSLGPEQLPAAVANLKAERVRLQDETAVVDELRSHVRLLTDVVRDLEAERDRLREGIMTAEVHGELIVRMREGVWREFEFERDRLRAVVDRRADDHNSAIEALVDIAGMIALGDGSHEDTDIVNGVRELRAERDRLRAVVSAQREAIHARNCYITADSDEERDGASRAMDETRQRLLELDRRPDTGGGS